MFCTIAFFIVFLAAAKAGYPAVQAYPQASYSHAAPHTVTAPAVVSQESNIIHSQGTTSQYSAYSKSMNTPYYKSGVRVSDDNQAYPYAYGKTAAPAYIHTYATPIYSHNYIVPAYGSLYVAPGYVDLFGLLSNTHSPATAAAHFSFINGYGFHYSQ